MAKKTRKNESPKFVDTVKSEKASYPSLVYMKNEQPILVTLEVHPVHKKARFDIIFDPKSFGVEDVVNILYDKEFLKYAKKTKAIKLTGHAKSLLDAYEEEDKL